MPLCYHAMALIYKRHMAHPPPQSNPPPLIETNRLVWVAESSEIFLSREGDPHLDGHCSLDGQSCRDGDYFLDLVHSVDDIYILTFLLQ